MVTSYTQWQGFEPYSAFDDLYLPDQFYYQKQFDAASRDQKNAEPEYWKKYKGAAVSDETFALSDRFATAQEVDDVENMTLQVITHLYSVVDRKKRTDIEQALTKNHHSEDESLFSPSTKFSYSQQFRPFERDTNFNDEMDNRPIHVQSTVQGIFSTLAKIFWGEAVNIQEIEQSHFYSVYKIFLGQKFIDEQKELMSFNEIDKTYLDDKNVWNTYLQPHYPSMMFQKKMERAFFQAQELIKKRKADEIAAQSQRSFFYMALGFSVIGNILGQRVISILGVGVSVITFLFMLRHYGTNTFMQYQQAADLKVTMDDVYEASLTARKPSSPELDTKFSSVD